MYAKSLERRLPMWWDVVRIPDSGPIEVTAKSLDVICLVSSSLTTGKDIDRVRRVETAARTAGIPVLGFTLHLSPTALFGIRHLQTRELLIDGLDHRDLAGTLRQVAARPVFEHIRRVVRSRFERNVALRAALGYLVGQVPPAAPVAVESGAENASPLDGPISVRFCRRVKDLPKIVGVSLSHLEETARSERVSLSEFVRNNTILHGMAVHDGKNTRDVAYRLGFGSAEAFRVLLRRHTNRNLEDLKALPLGHHGQRLLQVIRR